MRHYASEQNPSLREQKTARQLLETFLPKDRTLVESMSKKEIEYLFNDCGISDYVDYLREGRLGQTRGSEFPILVIQGTPEQLEKYRLILLLSLIDYQGEKNYYPNDFALGLEALEEIKSYTGVAFVRVKKGSATSQGLDEHRSELILGALLNRRDYFNPTVVLAEEVIQGKLNMSDGDIVKVIRINQDKLKDEKNTFEATIKSRIKPVGTFNSNYTPINNYPQSGNTYNNNNIVTKGKNNKKSADLVSNNIEALKRERGIN